MPTVVFSSLYLYFWLWAHLAAMPWPHLWEICVQIGPVLQVTMLWWQAELFLARTYARTWGSPPNESKSMLHSAWLRAKEVRASFRMFRRMNHMAFSGGLPTPPWQLLTLHPVNLHMSSYIHEGSSVLGSLIIPCVHERSIWAWNPKF